MDVDFESFMDLGSAGLLPRLDIYDCTQVDTPIRHMFATLH